MVMVSHRIKQLLPGECLLSIKYVGKSPVELLEKWKQFLWGNNALLEKRKYCYWVGLSKTKYVGLVML